MPPEPFVPFSKEETRHLLISILGELRLLNKTLNEHGANLQETTAALDQNLTALSSVARAQAVGDASEGVLGALQQALGGGAGPRRRRGR